MITIISLISFFTIVYWMRKWDKSIKNRVSIREYLPKEDDPISLMLVVIPTVITVIAILYLMLTYLP
jgi:hypothetical protein